MTNYKELIDAAKVTLDSEIAKERMRAKQEAEDFFQKNKECLVYSFLSYTISKMKRYVATEFAENITFNVNIKCKTDVYREEFKNILSELIKDALKELTPNYCKYDVHIGETALNSLLVKITMTICE